MKDTTEGISVTAKKLPNPDSPTRPEGLARPDSPKQPATPDLGNTPATPEPAGPGPKMGKAGKKAGKYDVPASRMKPAKESAMDKYYKPYKG